MVKVYRLNFVQNASKNGLTYSVYLSELRLIFAFIPHSYIFGCSYFSGVLKAGVGYKRLT